ncbi:MAG: nitrogenase cofactor biosynthesis protein NifB [Methanomassiliicoccales archaeon]
MYDSEVKSAIDTHPCFNAAAHRKYARMHLPVAPACNIQCNYCDRRYDCVNESRPGVTSQVMGAEEAVEKIRRVREEIPQLSVIGIAGPGDPLANDATFHTLERVHEEFPDLTLCLSTNGLNLPKYVDRLAQLNVKFVTVTMNAVDPDVGKHIYEYVRWEGKKLEGREAAERLIENQLEGIERAVDLGMCVKVNTVFIPDINGKHIPELAKRVKGLGAYISNIIPLIPVPGTKFENMRPPTPKERKELQDLCEVDIRQMRHCKMCRSDAIGLLGHDRSAEFATTPCGECREDRQSFQVMRKKDSYRVGVASSDGEKVDLHFGQADHFYTFEVESGALIPRDVVEVETYEEVPMFGKVHTTKLEKASDALNDCDIVIASDFGQRAVDILNKHGIAVFKFSGNINDAARAAARYMQEDREDMFE